MLQPPPPLPAVNLIPTVQQAITSLLTTYEPTFLAFGLNMFKLVATTLIVWNGIRFMFSEGSPRENLFEFVKLTLFIQFGYALIAFYDSPIPGVGLSFSHVLSDQPAYFMSVLETRTYENVNQHLDELWKHFLQPDPWSILANLIYWTVLLLVVVAKALSLAVISFGLIASAVCRLLGPLFVPFFIIPKLDRIFWGWLMARIQYEFIPVVAIAVLMLFEQFVYRYVTTLPLNILPAEYGVYGIQAAAVLITFCFGILLVPSLTNSIFSGSSGESVMPTSLNFSRLLRR